LRRKLDPLGAPLIHTQRGVGYALRPAPAAPPTASPPPHGAARSPAHSSARSAAARGLDGG
ncbi:MAG TPA: hypothetical protein VKD26_14255, partial [Streptosporangiaceae bacterium]|nr:hypothetical protein [Streptosporangiaceae bacterium]